MTPKEDTNHQNNPRDSVSHREVQEYAQWTRGHEEHDAIFLGPEGTGPPVEACREGGADVMVTDAVRGKELPLERRTTRGLHGLGRRLRAKRGGKQDKGHGRHRHREWDSRGKYGPG